MDKCDGSGRCEEESLMLIDFSCRWSDNIKGGVVKEECLVLNLPEWLEFGFKNI